jgi:hypothetical protein
MNVERRFIFRGNAFGIGGQIREPYLPYFEVQAASSLPTVGGVSRSEAKGHDYSRLLSFGFARTEARGGVPVQPYGSNFGAVAAAAVKDRDYTTIVQAELFDLQVEGRLVVRRMSMALRSHEEPGADEPSVIPEQTEISGVTLDGCAIDVILDPAPFQEAPTKSALRSKYKQKKWRDKYKHRFFRRAGAKNEAELSESKSLVLATIVDDIVIHHEPDCDRHQGPLKKDGNRIIVPNFGSIFFGELIISDYYRRLSAVRLALGSPMQADLECAGIESNGGGAP